MGSPRIDMLSVFITPCTEPTRLQCAVLTAVREGEDVAAEGNLLRVERRWVRWFPRREGAAPEDADQWKGVPDKFAKHFKAEPGSC